MTPEPAGAVACLPTYGRPGGSPVTLLAAAVLAVEGLSFMLAGSSALWLHGEPITVGDTDVEEAIGVRPALG
jgi:hypothetical protein